jgi:DNA-binding beta-propeller fold protein YncE
MPPSRGTTGLHAPEIALVLVLAAIAGACVPQRDRADPPARPRPPTTARPDAAAAPGASKAPPTTVSGAPAAWDPLPGMPPPLDPLPGMPPPLDPRDVYAAERPGKLSPAVRGFRPLVYVPNSRDGTVDGIDPRTFKVVRHFATGREPQHVTPSWDLRRLWVANAGDNTLTPIDPRTGKPGRRVPVADPYNLYFTPDGRDAVVVAEALRRLDFREPRRMRLRERVPVPCEGVDHLDFSPDGRSAVISCEFSSQLLKLDVRARRVAGTLRLRPGSMPQDVKLSPDGRVFHVADMAAGGVWLVDGDAFKVIGFVPTGNGAHGLYPSRDSKLLYISNRDAGSISLLSFATRKVVRTWQLPGGGSPDMGGVSADGKVLWLSGRYHQQVYAIDTRSGRLLARVPVGAGPHGLCVYPQPGRYSLGHAGVFR